jgi:hypothetical protein
VLHWYQPQTEYNVNGMAKGYYHAMLKNIQLFYSLFLYTSKCNMLKKKRSQSGFVGSSRSRVNPAGFVGILLIMVFCLT